MARTESSMLALGTIAPDFSLPEPLTGRTVSLEDIAGPRATLVMFICNHCPFVKHLLDELIQLGEDYRDQPIGIVAISSNDPTGYPQDRPERMAALARDRGLAFPYLHDPSQQVARAYSATCTPDFFLFDGERSLVYRGQFDDSRPGNGRPVTGKDLRTAIDAVLGGQPVPSEQRPSIGCSIKWKES
ncbi:thioredoxin family protein [Wenzhouxiangella marina]|uniref:Alkyl hydroperoxide reductase n=1 Tax=Wenzhouxiangella marina TaxID=1579979 RepID=A0A0K0Y013_9GAMM|nr:thioredoxin family protein [Wenzhouxiangella marina]AKS43279.1 alkyl hydroperoxide reductase [Wenzhouxiangella marina]MBB6087033.1 peroxiredoxin [Wenzhouxiangella marina]